MFLRTFDGQRSRRLLSFILGFRGLFFLVRFFLLLRFDPRRFFLLSLLLLPTLLAGLLLLIGAE